MPTTKTGYINGSDLLLKIGGVAVGHCTTHTTTFNSETKDRAVKPVASATIATGLWKGKGVTGLSVSINFEGLSHYDEAEGGFKSILNAWKTGQPVTVVALERESSDPYLTGSFIISSLEQSSPAQDDVTYSGTLENNGEVTIDPTKITGETLPSV